MVEWLGKEALPMPWKTTCPMDERTQFISIQVNHADAVHAAAVKRGLQTSIPTASWSTCWPLREAIAARESVDNIKPVALIHKGICRSARKRVE